MSPKTETVKHPRRAEEEGVACREGGREDPGVDDVGEDFDAGAGHGNDIGRVCSVSSGGKEIRIVVRDYHTRNENTEHLST